MRRLASDDREAADELTPIVAFAGPANFTDDDWFDEQDALADLADYHSKEQPL